MINSFIRNFCIISHIDHGKSTLADRFLEITNTVDPRKMQSQYLDRMALEREKGITIKMQPCRMNYDFNDQKYILNLIDTPGHVDFSYEVSRSLAAVEGVILLVDATKGIQAQTVSNLEMAKQQKLAIIPVVNKIDIASSEQVEQSKTELINLLNLKSKQIYLISALTGQGVEELLRAVIKKIPAPESEQDFFRALIFDSEYDFYKGVIVYLRVVDGEIKSGDKIYLLGSGTKGEAVELGWFKPELVSSKNLTAGEVGYLATGLKNIENCRVGDTITRYQQKHQEQTPQPLRGYREPQPKVFASFYPVDSDNYEELKQGLGKLKLNDASLVFEPESSQGLGRGFRCGFLGMLHLEIVSERLRRDYNLDLVITSPNVIYRTENKVLKEPWVKLEVIAPKNYLGSVMKLLETISGKYKNTKNLGQEKVIIEFETPLSEIIRGFYDKLKSTTSGYGSMNYEFLEYREGDLVKLEIILAGEKIDAFSRIISQKKAYSEARKITQLLKEIIPAHQFAVPIQAAVNGKIIARETKKALKKDVTGDLYGGDYTRKKKLLKKQRKGKKKLAKFGKVNIPSQVFLKVLKQI